MSAWDRIHAHLAEQAPTLLAGLKPGLDQAADSPQWRPWRHHDGERAHAQAGLLYGHRMLATHEMQGVLDGLLQRDWGWQPAWLPISEEVDGLYYVDQAGDHGPTGAVYFYSLDGDEHAPVAPSVQALVERIARDLDHDEIRFCPSIGGLLPAHFTEGISALALAVSARISGADEAQVQEVLDFLGMSVDDFAPYEPIRLDEHWVFAKHEGGIAPFVLEPAAELAPASRWTDAPPADAWLDEVAAAYRIDPTLTRQVATQAGAALARQLQAGCAVHVPKLGLLSAQAGQVILTPATPSR